MGRMTCFSHSGVAEVLGALDVFRGVPGGAEHFEALDDFERVPAGVASPGPSKSLKMSALASSRVWNSCVRSFSPAGFSKCVKEKNESVSIMPMIVDHGRWYHGSLVTRHTSSNARMAWRWWL